ncbi:MAG: hypothetical protein GC154_03685 [bacterium]|nr:hypothetical protein [bacterium]
MKIPLFAVSLSLILFSSCASMQDREFTDYGEDLVPGYGDETIASDWAVLDFDSADLSNESFGNVGDDILEFW